jgi:hypothetical protein
LHILLISFLEHCLVIRLPPFQVAREIAQLCDFFKIVKEENEYRFYDLLAILRHKVVHI